MLITTHFCQKGQGTETCHLLNEAPSFKKIVVPLAFQKADRFQVLNTHGYDKVGDTHAIKE